MLDGSGRRGVLEELLEGEELSFLAGWASKLAGAIARIAGILHVAAGIDDEKGWQPTPFIPWHQPFFNEAGHFTARIVMPSDQLLACSKPLHPQAPSLLHRATLSPAFSPSFQCPASGKLW